MSVLHEYSNNPGDDIMSNASTEDRPSAGFDLTPVEAVPERTHSGSNANARRYDDLAERIKAHPGQTFALGVHPQSVAAALHKRGIKTAMRDVGVGFGNPKNVGTVFAVYVPEEDPSNS